MQQNPPYKLIIVDDEPNICVYLQSVILEQLQDKFTICGIAHNTDEAAVLLNEHQPHVALFDIHLPSENAIDFLKKRSDKASIIFITAYDEYALPAFKLHAIDFLTKPVNQIELVESLTWYYESIVKNKAVKTQEQLADLSKRTHISINTHHGLFVIPLSSIILIDAHSSYSEFHYVEDEVCKAIYCSKAINYFEDALDDTFIRIHKSTVVNSQHIVKVTKERQVVLRGELKREISTRKFAELKQFLIK
jgi:DNA-binding LytR/AlgR family response regulator